MNEDFIISSEELKANQARAIEKELEIIEEKKEARREMFLIVFIALIFITLIVAISKKTDEAIENCINGGHSQSFCEKYLAD